MREQLVLFQSEYSFYKEIAERLESKQGSGLDQMQSRLTELTEREKDINMRCNDLQKENQELGTLNRQLMQEQQRMQRDLKQIMQINDEFQNQSGAFRDRESQFVELGREYREKLEILKFERERIALKEEQFLSQIHKVETEQKQEVKRAQNKFES